MIETLAQKKCTPCRGGVPPLTHEEAERFQSQTPNWDLFDDSHRIERTFRFRNFQEAFGFVRNVGDLAAVRHQS
jgi:4a-hydroxytetrahydrobiopterin dehydratase